MGDSWDRGCSATLRTLRPLWAGRNKAVFRTLANQLLWKPRLFEALMRAHDTASLLGRATRGAVRLLMEIALATPRRIYISAGVAALVAGIGGNALLLQMGRHPTPVLASVAHDPLSASASTAAPPGTVEPVAPHLPPTPTSEYSTASAPAGDISRATQASAPDITSSFAPAAQDKQHQSSASKGERRFAALGPDQIGALLRGKPDDGSFLVRPAQVALAKLGYAVKSNGVEDGATRRALRQFERAHGLTPTTKISSELVKQLKASPNNKRIAVRGRAAG
jgi:Putative peptidoglycan binding domain